MHQAVLRSFVHTAAAPGISSLARHAAPFDGSQVLAELAGRIAAGELEVPIAATYPLADVRAAYTELARGHTHGKIVLLP